MTIKEVQEKNINFYGARVEAKKLIEEASELLEAIVDYENGKCDFNHVVEEFADVMFVAGQFNIFYKIERKEVIKIAKEKALRQLKRMGE